MKIQSWCVNFRGDDEVQVNDLEDFVSGALVLKDGKDTPVQFASSEEKIPLEKQPVEIARAFGKLVSLLADKGLLTCEEVQMIVEQHLNEASFIKEK
jgi:hypothetical protein